MGQPTKTAQIQLRVTPAVKRALVRHAREAGMDLSSWMIGRLLPSRQLTFEKLVRSVASAAEPSYALAELGALLSSLAGAELRDVVGVLPAVQLSDVLANQIAAMVETVATRHRVRPPPWVDEILPLRSPWFPTALLSVRLHLLCHAPPAFRRRNIFADSTLENRV
jgi:hypothetical protein